MRTGAAKFVSRTTQASCANDGQGCKRKVAGSCSRARDRLDCQQGETTREDRANGYYVPHAKETRP